METAKTVESPALQKKKAAPDLTNGNLFKQILFFALPLLATNILQLVFNTADTIVVGRWGGDTPEACEIALAAVGSSGSLSHLIINIFIGISLGANVCIARDIGAKHYEDASRGVHTSVLLSIFFGLFSGVVGFVFAEPLLTLTGVTDQLLHEATLYMRACFIGIPASLIYNFCASVLRADGDTKHPLIFLSIAGVVNVGLNLVMVLVFRLGAMGVGIATAASNWVSCFAVLVYLARKKGVTHLQFSRLRIHKDKTKTIIAIGIPAGISSSFFSLSNVITQSAINSFDETVIAANTAAQNLDGYIYQGQSAFSTAALTFVSQNIGAKKIDRVKKSIFFCALLAAGFSAMLGGIFFLLVEMLLSLYIPGNVAGIEIGMKRLLIVGATYPLCGLMETAAATLRGFGKSTISTVNSLCFACVFRIAWISFVFNLFHTIEMLYIIYPLSWILTSIANYIFCVVVFRKQKKKLTAAPLSATA